MANISISDVIIPCGEYKLNGILSLPPEAKSIVLFAHGSGSSRFSTRNQMVAKQLNEAGLATLLFDLLIPEEEAIDEVTRQFRFDIPRLAARLTGVTDWIAEKNLSIGFFGASTGAAAALMSASERPQLVKAVVSRGGRPDLAGEALNKVKAPTLLIVGGDDVDVITLNEEALQKLSCTKQLAIVPGATHLFEEPGKLDQVANLAKEWFLKYL